MTHKDLTEQIDRVRRVLNGEQIVRVYEPLTFRFEAYQSDLRDIAYAAIERIDQEREANDV